MQVKYERSWDTMYHHGITVNNFFQEVNAMLYCSVLWMLKYDNLVRQLTTSQWVRETASEVRIYLVLGAADNHIGLLSALQVRNKDTITYGCNL